VQTWSRRRALARCFARWKQCLRVTHSCRALLFRHYQKHLRDWVKRWQIAAALKVMKRASQQTAMLQFEMTLYAKVLAAWSNHTAMCRIVGMQP
jgi:hypothetical protein